MCCLSIGIQEQRSQIRDDAVQVSSLWRKFIIGVLHIQKGKTIVLLALHMHLSFLFILQQFLSYQ